MRFPLRALVSVNFDSSSFLFGCVLCVWMLGKWGRGKERVKRNSESVLILFFFSDSGNNKQVPTNEGSTSTFNSLFCFRIFLSLIGSFTLRNHSKKASGISPFFPGGSPIHANPRSNCFEVFLSLSQIEFFFLLL